jgi:hypothetical protein
MFNLIFVNKTRFICYLTTKSKAYDDKETFIMERIGKLLDNLQPVYLTHPQNKVS